MKYMYVCPTDRTAESLRRAHFKPPELDVWRQMQRLAAARTATHWKSCKNGADIWQQPL
jgi:hypothetical protein